MKKPSKTTDLHHDAAEGYNKKPIEGTISRELGNPYLRNPDNLKLKRQKELAVKIAEQADSLKKIINEYGETEEEKQSIFQSFVEHWGYSVALSAKAIVAESVSATVPPLTDPAPALPTAPPNGERYKPRGPESAPIFIERVYGQWLTGEFTRADLRRLDEKAEMALRNWEREHGRAPINLPTKKERNDKLVEQGLALDRRETAREYERRRQLINRRKQ